MLMDDASIRKLEELIRHHIGVPSEEFQQARPCSCRATEKIVEKVDRL